MTSAAERRLPRAFALPWSSSAESASADLVPRVAPWIVLTSALMPLLLTTAWLVADTLQPASYSPVRETVSVLSGYGGTDRWIVTTALYVIGVAYLVTAAGVNGLAAASRLGLLVAGVASIGVALFPEPAHGTSREHVVFTGVGAIAIAVWPALAARQRSVLTAVGPRRTYAAIAVSMGLLLWTAAETRNGSSLGLAERVSSALQVCWPFVVVLMLRRAQPVGSGARQDARVDAVLAD